jgi:hypothetical protein
MGIQNFVFLTPYNSATLQANWGVVLFSQTAISSRKKRRLIYE